MSFTHHDIKHAARRRSKRVPYAGETERASRLPQASLRATAMLQRPDPSILNAAIPVVFIGRNTDGFWVARNAERKTGGIFLRRSSAIYFAKQRTAPGGCAIVDLPGTFELDIDNEGNPYIARIAALKRRLLGLTRQLASMMRRLGSPTRRLTARLSRARAAQRLHRKAIERELFRNRYRLASKSDDDLPIAR